MPSYECQGIGHGSVCGLNATVPIKSYVWNAAKQKVEETVVYLCEKHAQELRDFQDEVR